MDYKFINIKMFDFNSILQYPTNTGTLIYKVCMKKIKFIFNLYCKHTTHSLVGFINDFLNIFSSQFLPKVCLGLYFQLTQDISGKNLTL